MHLDTRVYGIKAIVCFDVFMLIRFLKDDRYSDEAIKLVINVDVMYVRDVSLISLAMSWLKMAEL